MSFNRSLILIALLLSLTPSVFGQTKFGLSEYPKMVNLSDSQISPDGKSVVVVVSRPDYDKNRNNAELVMIDILHGEIAGHDDLVFVGHIDKDVPNFLP